MAPIESAPPVLNDNIVVRSNYNPKAKTFERPQAGDVEFLISPLTGERIPASKMSEHMRIGLLDPAWVEQRKKEIAKVLKLSSIFFYIFKEKRRRRLLCARCSCCELSVENCQEANRYFWCGRNWNWPRSRRREETRR